jgi:hypothetical protein
MLEKFLPLPEIGLRIVKITGLLSKRRNAEKKDKKKKYDILH